MQCQAETHEARRCKHRGRRINGCPYWLCRQHYDRELSLDFYLSDFVLYEPQLLGG